MNMNLIFSGFLFTGNKRSGFTGNNLRIIDVWKRAKILFLDQKTQRRSETRARYETC
jgi:hypothetical protein